MTTAPMTNGFQALLAFAPSVSTFITGQQQSLAPSTDARHLVASFLPQDVGDAFLSASAVSKCAADKGIYYFSPTGKNGVVRGFELKYQRLQTGVLIMDVASRLAIVDGCEVEQKTRVEVSNQKVRCTHNALTFLLSAKCLEDAVVKMSYVQDEGSESFRFPFSSYPELLEACVKGKIHHDAALLLASLFYSPTLFPEMSFELMVNKAWHKMVCRDDRFVLASASKVKMGKPKEFVSIRNGEYGQSGRRFSIFYDREAPYIFHNIFEPTDPMLVITEEQEDEAVGEFSAAAQFLLGHLLMRAEERVE